MKGNHSYLSGRPGRTNRQALDENKQKNHPLMQCCSNRGPQGPLEWPAKQFSLERKLNTLIITVKRIF